MKRGRPFIILILLCVKLQATSAQTLTPKQFYDWMSVSSDTVDYRWYDTAYIKTMNKLAIDSYRKYPKDQYTPYVLGYSIHAFRLLNLRGISREQVDSVLTEIDGFQKKAILKDAFYYNCISFYYNNLYVMYYFMNELDEANKALYFSELSLQQAHLIAVPGTKLYNSIINKLVGLYNNKAILLYKSTHHLDSDNKRREASPIMLNLLDKADSLGTLYVRNVKMDRSIADRLISVYINKYLIYGAYLPEPDSGKAAYNFKRAKELIPVVCSDNKSFSCINSKFHVNTSIFWVYFASQNFEAAISEGRKAYDSLIKKQETDGPIGNGNSFINDIRFGLTDSYMKLGKPDSAYYFGELFLSDTISTKDYSGMSEIASIMAELSLGKKDINRAREFLQLSKDCIRKSKSEQIRTKLVREGEIKLLNQSLERIIEVQESIRKNEAERMRVLIIFLVTGFLLSVFFAIYILRKLALQKATV